HVGASQSAAQRTCRQWKGRADICHVHVNLQVIHRPDVARTVTHALSEVDRAVTFEDVAFVEARSREVSVDVAGEDEVASRTRLGPSSQNLKTRMWMGVAIQIQPMP